MTQAARSARPVLLVVNCGSSSVKCQLLDMARERALAGGQLDPIVPPVDIPGRQPLRTPLKEETP